MGLRLLGVLSGCRVRSGRYSDSLVADVGPSTLERAGSGLDLLMNRCQMFVFD